MKYPKFLNKKSTIGITALSKGAGHKIESLDKAINNLSRRYKVCETNNVRVNNIISSDASTRINQFNELLTNKKINLILAASGGEFLIDILPLLDYKLIKKNKKLIMGYSDITNLLYIITTKLDIITLYGFNATSFDEISTHQLNCFEILNGNLIKQENYNKYIKNDTEYEVTIHGSVFTTGRLIGGCLDCLTDLFKSKYDNTLKFIEKYKNDGIIWYFDIYSMSAIELYKTLFIMKDNGYFNYCKAILIGRIAYPNNIDFTYTEALNIIKDIPIITGLDIGHTNPRFTLINGCLCEVFVENGKCILQQKVG